MILLFLRESHDFFIYGCYFIVHAYSLVARPAKMNVDHQYYNELYVKHEEYVLFSAFCGAGRQRDKDLSWAFHGLSLFFNVKF